MHQQSRSVQVKVAVAFAAVVIGFIGTAAYVPRAVWAYTLRAEEIQKQYAEDVAVLAEMRGCGREVRQGALLAFHERDPAARAAYEADVARARARCASALAAHSASLRARGHAADPGRTGWEHYLSQDAPAHRRAVDAVLAQSHLAVRDPTVLRALFETVADGDAHLQSIVALYAASTKTSAAEIHAGLRRLSTLYAALAAVGAIGALVLLVETLRTLRRYLRAVDRRVADLDAFGGQVAHDLRGPLQTIQLAVAIIQKKTDDPALQRLARGAASGVARLDAMIGDLLQFARGGSRDAGKACGNVAAVVAETCEGLLPLAERANVQVTVDAGSDLFARIEPIAVQTIVTNLVENAIKYRSHERENEVVVTARADGDGVRLTVRDRGSGIDPALLPRIFEPFVRGSDRPDSYGLGLATVKRLVDAHDGTLGVESTPGVGTTFEIRLPSAARRSGRSAAGAGRPAPAPVVQGRPAEVADRQGAPPELPR